MDTPVIVAIIAASASVVAASIAGVMSHRATKGARAITSLNQSVARLDAESAELREDFRKFLEVLGGVAVLTDVGRLLAASELLQAHPRATPKLCSAARAITDGVSMSFVSPLSRALGRPLPGLTDQRFMNLRSGFAESMRALSDARSGLLA